MKTEKISFYLDWLIPGCSLIAQLVYLAVGLSHSNDFLFLLSAAADILYKPFLIWCLLMIVSKCIKKTEGFLCRKGICLSDSDRTGWRNQ